MFLHIILFLSVDYLLCSKISKLFLQKEIEIQPYIPARSFLVFLFSGFPKSFKISSAVTLLISSYRSMFSKSFDHSTLNTSCPRCSKAFPMLQRRKVKDFFIKFKKKSHFADFLTEQTLDFVLHRLFCGLAEMDTDDIGCLADLLSDSRASGAVGCGIVHSKSSCNINGHATAHKLLQQKFPCQSDVFFKGKLILQGNLKTVCKLCRLSMLGFFHGVP